MDTKIVADVQSGCKVTAFGPPKQPFVLRAGNAAPDAPKAVARARLTVGDGAGETRCTRRPTIRQSGQFVASEAPPDGKQLLAEHRCE